MTAADAGQLRRFFGLGSADEECRFYLPVFAGQANSESGWTPPVGIATAKEDFRYPGHTFADRDAKSASYVSSVLSRAVEFDHIQWESVGTFTPPGQSGTIFLFGSRSNQAAEWATATSGLGKFFKFEFGPTWSIRCAGNRVFSLQAPNTLSRNDYENQTDYGVIGRFQKPIFDAHVFLIAGLGSRATEGCGYYLAGHWNDLARTFQDKDFAIVLKFQPPIDPKKSEVVVAFDDGHTEGFLPVF